MIDGAAARTRALVALLVLLTLAASLLAIRAAGASTAMLAVQAAAGLIAAASIFLMSRVRSALSARAQTTTMALSLFAVAATALFGVTMDGATRWIGVGPSSSARRGKAARSGCDIGGSRAVNRQ